ncbi:MAG: oligoribonuclease [marine actinobacterium MedAcidi-G2B]|mgnify:FL=1|nr:MAG: oligoribonuclease [marine actinobacterium MedAcidi-G2B]MAU49897.1 oligoribonuclease [Actinomycetota bacterium]MDC0245133.1 oligoribonuclease [Acidimicrobiaceae bacterium]|tara:strand:- start:20159 stop:20695 length:537 start_codon:yes stop_codon:yes gene_type:complete
MLVWIDLEMTGLDPERDVIVEIATLITSDELEIVAEGPDLVIHHPDETLSIMNDYVRNMHETSGLLTEIEQSSLSLEQAGIETLQFIQSHVQEAGSVPLCGNSIGTDRRFLIKAFPEIDNFLHYRCIDVSTIKELARRWNPDVLTNAPKKSGGHRALNDIQESVIELRYYRDHFINSN